MIFFSLSLSISSFNVIIFILFSRYLSDCSPQARFFTTLDRQISLCNMQKQQYLDLPMV